MIQPPWQVWVKLDGTLSVPREATSEDLLQLADKLMEFVAWTRKGANGDAMSKEQSRAGYNDKDEYKRWGDPLPLKGDRLSVNCVATTVIHMDNGTQRPDHVGEILILDFNPEAKWLKFVNLQRRCVQGMATEGTGWVRVFTRVLREMDYHDYYDGRRGGAFPEEEE